MRNLYPKNCATWLGVFLERNGQREEKKNPVRKSSEVALKFVFRINEIDLKLELVFASGKFHFYHLLV